MSAGFQPIAPVEDYDDASILNSVASSAFAGLRIERTDGRMDGIKERKMAIEK